MARITSKKAPAMVCSQFDLVLIAAHRARELSKGTQPKILTRNGPCITAIKEIERGLYTKQDYLDKMHKKGKL